MWACFDFHFGAPPPDALLIILGEHQNPDGVLWWLIRQHAGWVTVQNLPVLWAFGRA